MTVCDCCKQEKQTGMGPNLEVAYCTDGAGRFVARRELCQDCKRLLAELISDPEKFWLVLKANTRGAHPMKRVV